MGSSSSASTSLSCSSYQSPSASDFWKMVGFEVTPTTASSRISFARKPSRSHSREIESIQTDWPRSDNSCSLDVVMQRPFQLADFLQPLDVALAPVEARGEESADELDSELGADHLRAQAEHVHVVVLDALVRGVDVVADRCPNAGELAGGDRGADARAADEDSPVGVAALDRLAELTRLVRVVDPFGVRVGAEGDQHPLAQLPPAVVECDRDVHRTLGYGNGRA